MKDKNIKTINTAGLIGYIISILLIICSVTAMVGTILGTAAVISVKDEQVTVDVATDVRINSTGNILDKLNRYIKIDGVKNLGDLLTEDGSTLKLNDRDISEIKVENDENGLEINAKMNDAVFGAKRIIAALVCSFLMFAAVTVSLEMLKKLMKALKTCETPFTADVIKWMTRFAYSLIPSIVMYSAARGLWASLSGGSFSFSIDLGMVLLVAIVCMLIVVFKYGAQLQQESDETL